MVLLVSPSFIAYSCAALTLDTPPTATWSFLPSHAPNYLPGNALNLATGATTCCLLIGLLFWLRKENRARDEGKRDHLVEGLTPAEQDGLGVNHPSFRYSY